MEIIALIAAAILVLIVLGTIDHSAAEFGRSVEGGAPRPRYKPHWQAVALIVANGLVIAAYFYSGITAAALTTGALFLSYIVFRLFLFRSPRMQRRFLTVPLPPDAS